MRFWSYLGWVSFGGPAGQIALLHQELVERRRWISEGRFLHALNFCMVLPGPEALQLVIYTAWLMHRRIGGLIAGLLFILPSFALLVLLSWLYARFGQLPWLAALFHGIKPVVTALILQACLRIGKRTLRTHFLQGIAAAAFVGMYFLNLPFPLIMLLAALLGVVNDRLRTALPRAGAADDGFAPAAGPQAGGSQAGGSQATGSQAAGSQAGGSQATGSQAAGSRAAEFRSVDAGQPVIDDDAPLPADASGGLQGAGRTAVTGLLAWLLPMLVLSAAFGSRHVLTEMGWFFSKAALLSFGGAYAVLPYVFQGAVTHFGWLTPAQMLDGLALGESTPGPLIIVVAFVGFVGAWQQAPFGPDHLLPAGALGALVVCWFTFLPSFLMVLSFAPLVEAGRALPRLTAPLTAMTAATVGVILNLGVFFAQHVIWPSGLRAGMDRAALVIAAVALIALIRVRLPVPSVLLLAGLLGWGLSHCSAC